MARRRLAPARRVLRCTGCGGDYTLSARADAARRQQEREPCCRSCRTGNGPRPATDADRRYWLDRFTLDEIREMAAALWPEDARRALPGR